MTITTLYRVEVEIPEDVYQEHGHTPAYERAVLLATEGVESGSDSYAQVYEWAETDNRALAERVEKALQKIAAGDLS